LRGVHTPAEPVLTPAPGPPRVYDPVLSHPDLPPAARELLQELLDLRLTEPPAVRQFLTRTADRLTALTTRDRSGHAAAHAGLLTALDHPHIVAAYDAGVLTAPGQPALHYLVLELVPGGDLEQYIYDHGPQPVDRACEWARQVAAGLQAAHDRHLVHRDLKPS